ncbi:MAG: DUF1304 domain-containing protein [Bdellovibrionales bacterium]|nr:DUF1304 domain-containing protein [Bdellovibrionales bacterium]
MPQFFALIAGIIHVYIFLMESLLWGSPKTNKAFGVSAEMAEANRLFAFNQGYYNLFLAIAVFLGVGLSFTEFAIAANTLIVYSSLSMLGAALVLISSNRKMIRPALVQGFPPFLAVVFWLLKKII